MNDPDSVFIRDPRSMIRRLPEQFDDSTSKMNQFSDQSDINLMSNLCRFKIDLIYWNVSWHDCVESITSAGSIKSALTSNGCYDFFDKFHIFAEPST